MPDYGLQYNTQQVISGSIYLFASGTLADSSTAISASSNQIIAITCSANFNNRLTKLTSMNANATITITSGSSDREALENDTKLILRYYSGSEDPIDLIPSSSDSTIDHLLGGIETNIIYVDIPLLNNDDSFIVATKTVRALTASIGYNSIFGAALVDDGSTFQLSSSLGENMKVGTSFEIRDSLSYELHDDYLLSSSGFFTITSLNSGSVATPDFSGTEVQVGGMQLGTSFMIGGGSGSQAFAFNLIQTGSGFLNQTFFPGFPMPQSASIGMTLDPADSSSGLITGSGVGSLYMSSSGQIGLSTTEPITDVDIRADNFQIQRKAERRGIKINDEGNVESFDKNALSATTGSEFILNYSRGVSVTKAMLEEVFGGTYEDDAAALSAFNALKPETQIKILNTAEIAGFITPPSAGDIMGSIRWVAESGSNDSYDKRKAGESAAIRAIIADIDEDGVQADLVFSVASKAGAPLPALKLDALGNHEMTGSFDIGGNLLVRGDISSVGDDITITDDLTVQGDIIGDNATDISQIRHLNVIGNATLGNHASDIHYITGETNMTGSLYVSGNITGSIVSASTLIGKIEGGFF